MLVCSFISSGKLITNTQVRGRGRSVTCPQRPATRLDGSLPRLGSTFSRSYSRATANHATISTSLGFVSSISICSCSAKSRFAFLFLRPAFCHSHLQHPLHGLHTFHTPDLRRDALRVCQNLNISRRKSCSHQHFAKLRVRQPFWSNWTS
jgi:hypothetical protein